MGKGYLERYNIFSADVDSVIVISFTPKIYDKNSLGGAGGFFKVRKADCTIIDGKFYLIRYFERIPGKHLYEQPNHSDLFSTHRMF